MIGSASAVPSHAWCLAEPDVAEVLLVALAAAGDRLALQGRSDAAMSSQLEHIRQTVVELARTERTARRDRVEQEVLARDRLYRALSRRIGSAEAAELLVSASGPGDLSTSAVTRSAATPMRVAAEHEAAHAVVGRHFGAVPVSVTADRDGGGHVVFRPDAPTAFGQAATAAAGGLWDAEFGLAEEHGADWVDQAEVERLVGAGGVWAARHEARVVLTRHETEVLKLADRIIGADGQLVLRGEP